MIDYNHETGNVTVEADARPATVIHAVALYYKHTGLMPKSRAIVDHRYHRVSGFEGKPSDIVREFSMFLDPESRVVLNMVSMFEGDILSAHI